MVPFSGTMFLAGFGRDRFATRDRSRWVSLIRWLITGNPLGNAASSWCFRCLSGHGVGNPWVQGVIGFFESYLAIVKRNEAHFFCLKRIWKLYLIHAITNSF